MIQNKPNNVFMNVVRLVDDQNILQKQVVNFNSE